MGLGNALSRHAVQQPILYLAPCAILDVAMYAQDYRTNTTEDKLILVEYAMKMGIRNFPPIIFIRSCGALDRDACT